MKKYIRLITLMLSMMLIITGCGNNTTNNNQNSEKHSQQEDIKNTEDKDDSKNTEDVQNTETDKNTEITENTEDVTQNQTPEITETETKMYANATVNIRSLPSTDGEKLGTLSKNQEVTALGEAENGWQKIRYNDGIAYVSAQYLAKEKIESTTQNQTQNQTQMQVDEITAEDLSLPADFDPNGIVVVIDPGHQGKWNNGKEPDGPGSSTMKTKVSAGATGCVTKQYEYVLNLAVSMKLKEELKSRGYQVVMIRETHSINISNSERAKFANKIGADAFIRIHANSSDKSSVSGVETICQTSKNPYNANIYKECYKLSECVLDGFVESTGAKKRHVWQTDTMSGINWCQVPVTILEMGFLSNPEEDKLMASEDYQNKMVEGVANGIDKYFGK